ncbi:SNF2 family N-terminal domain-containing protein [Hypoxylon sp. FL1284]|nr:SNF2 family N-terminal domain-containing protein [Hypoxylon sp. FL1284]
MSLGTPDRIRPCDSFLQQPDSYDATRPYHNPQYLLHPDKETETSWSYDEIPARQAAVLEQNEKSKVTELLDSAAGPGTFRRIDVSDILVTELKDHQKKALSMMVEKEAGRIRDAEFASVWVESSGVGPSYARFRNTVTQQLVAQEPKLCLGGLLADDMGLGKTLTTLALITTSLGGKDQCSGGTLIVCPLCQAERSRHFKPGSLTYRIYHGSARDDNAAALGGFDIVLTSYETLRSELPHDEIERMKPRKSRRIGLLHSMNWHRVVLDEAHIVRNRLSKTFEAVKMLEARHRWCLSGTPIQNRLEDLGSLVEFLRVFPFHNHSVFKSTFITPIEGGDLRGWERLRSLIKGIALRRTKKALDTDLKLPPRQERIHEVYLNNEEKAVYDLVKKKMIQFINSSASTSFQLILRLRQICNHGEDLLPYSMQDWLRKVSVFGNASLPQLQSCEACDTSLDDGHESSYCGSSCIHQICQACLQRLHSLRDSTDTVACLLCDSEVFEKVKTSPNSTATPKPGLLCHRPSSKVRALLQNLQKDHEAAIVSGRPPIKSVVFSTWTGMLDLIGRALSAKGIAYERLDGSINLAQRHNVLTKFRSNPGCTVLLASLGSAAVGLDLTTASRVHLMEPGWNPLLEQQAIDRVHRLGQEKAVVATRYIVSGSDSIEQYVRKRQVQKMNLIASSLDDSMARLEEVKALLTVSLINTTQDPSSPQCI